MGLMPGAYPWSGALERCSTRVSYGFKAHIQVSQFSHIKLVRLRNKKRTVFSKMHKLHAKLASEIGRVNEPLFVNISQGWKV